MMPLFSKTEDLKRYNADLRHQFHVTVVFLKYIIRDAPIMLQQCYYRVTRTRAL